jgi:lipopolysaccharide export system protein LptC
MSAAAAVLPRTPRPDLLRWKRRSKLIAVFRRLLPAAMGLIILLLAGQVLWSSIVASQADTADKPAPIRMINPRFQGREGNGSSFVISAQQATRDDRDLRRVTLDKAVITLGVDTGKPTRVTANNALYVEGDDIVRLSGDVQIDDASGYHFATERANLNTRTNAVEADAPLVGTGPIGEVQSQSYGVYDDGDRIIFRGGVRAKINQE